MRRDARPEPIPIDCGVCVIRSWRPGDERDLIHHADDPRVWSNLRDRFPHPYTMEDADSWIRLCGMESPETHFAIAVRDRVIGGIGFDLRGDVERCSAEIGYWVGPEHWGRGIATAALRALTDYAFEEHEELTRLFAISFARNTASRRVLEKAGYTLEGIMRRSAIKEGVIEDQALYARLRD